MDKCHICKAKFKSAEFLVDHYIEEHEAHIPEGWSAYRFYYLGKTGKEKGSCIVCKQDTEWNEFTNKYHRFCKNPKCKDKYREEFKSRMVGKYGKTHLLNEPDQQRKMLSKRSISGDYKWSDDTGIVGYTGSYEKDFLRFLDVFLNFDASDILSPSPHTYYYEYEGDKKFYIPDFYIASLNLEVEIKDGGDNPNNHHKIQNVDKEKEKLKDKLMMTQKNINYIKITNKEYAGFMGLLEKLKADFIEHGESKNTFYIIGESISYMEELKEVVLESTEENIFKQNLKVLTNVYPKLNTNAITFKEVEKELLELLDSANSPKECDNLIKTAKNSIILMKKLPNGDESLKYEVNKCISWIQNIFISNVNIKKHHLIKREYKRG